MLANSLKPRSGYDSRNSGNVKVNGAISGNKVNEVKIPNFIPCTNRRRSSAGVITLENGHIVAVYQGNMCILNKFGKILRIIDLCEFNGGKRYHSSPVAIDNGDFAVSLQFALLVFNMDGDLIFTKDNEDKYFFDDIGHSPNVTSKGEIIMSCPGGELLRFDGNRFVELGVYGYDVVQPALYQDDSMAVSGYFGKGFCRVAPNGEIIWKSGFYEADTCPSINSKGNVAVSSMNDRKSCIFSIDGHKLCEYAGVATFAEFSEENWVMKTSNNVMLVDNCGEIKWSREIESDFIETYQPVVDIEKRIYVPTLKGIHCFDSNGSIVFEFMTKQPPNDFAITQDGVIAVLTEDSISFFD